MSFSVEFEVLHLDSFALSRYSIFHCGTSKEMRMPWIVLKNQSATEGFRVKFSTISESNFGGWTGEELSENVTYHLDINVTQSRFTVSVDDVVLLDDIKDEHTLNESIPCYAGSPYYPAFDVELSSIQITSYSTSYPTQEPTNVPTAQPTSDPTANPTGIPSQLPTKEPITESGLLRCAYAYGCIIVIIL